MIRTRTVILLAVWLCGGAAGFAAQGSDPNQISFQEQLAELQLQMQQMQTQHDRQIQELEQRMDASAASASDTDTSAEEVDDEAALLRQMAEELAGDKPPEQKPEETVFKSVGTSLQKLNPEMSVAADLLFSYHDQEGTRQQGDVDLRGVELNFQAYLDPYSRMKAIFHVSDAGVDIEEVYMTLFGLFGGNNLDLGRFRQPFGVVNRWHEDALDQVNYPLPLQSIFGDEGLNQTGASLESHLPSWAGASQALTFQATAAENEQLFTGETKGMPSLLLHYKNFRDLTEDTYIEFGLSGLAGWNDEWDVSQSGAIVQDYKTRGTQVLGADFSMLWEPVDQAMYRGVEWRTELYFLNRDVLAPDNSGGDTLQSWGFYSYVQTKVNRRTQAGLRADYYRPDSKPYADTTGASLAPLAYTAENPYRWQFVPYLTWWQSEYVKFRTEYNYATGKGMEPHSHTVWLQAIFAMGPHKHDRY